MERELYVDLCSRIEKYFYSKRNDWAGKKIILYPYGHNGMMIHEILNYRYGIEVYGMIDNVLCKYNPKVKPVDWITESESADCLFLITANNLDIYYEIRSAIEKRVSANSIIDLFPDSPLLESNARVTSLAIASQEIYERKIGGGSCRSRRIPWQLCPIY